MKLDPLYVSMLRVIGSGVVAGDGAAAAGVSGEVGDVAAGVGSAGSGAGALASMAVAFAGGMAVIGELYVMRVLMVRVVRMVKVSWVWLDLGPTVHVSLLSPGVTAVLSGSYGKG